MRIVYKNTTKMGVRQNDVHFFFYQRQRQLEEYK